MNMYAYAGNNPVNRLDPQGTAWRNVSNFFTSEKEDRHTVTEFRDGLSVIRPKEPSTLHQMLWGLSLMGLKAITIIPNAIIIYRQGRFEDSSISWIGNFIKGKKWAREHPLTTQNFFQKYGLPAENTGSPDWVVKGRIDSNFTWGEAPGSHNNPLNTGGAIEIIPNNPNDVWLEWFHMP